MACSRRYLIILSYLILVTQTFTVILFLLLFLKPIVLLHAVESAVGMILSSLSVCLSVCDKCIVAKWYMLQQVTEQMQWHDFTTFNLPHRPCPFKLPTSWTIDVNWGHLASGEYVKTSCEQANSHKFHVLNSHRQCAEWLFQTMSYDWLFLSNGWATCLKCLRSLGGWCWYV